MKYIETKLVLAALIALLIAAYGWLNGPGWLLLVASFIATILGISSIVIVMWAHFTEHLKPEDPMWRPGP